MGNFGVKNGDLGQKWRFLRTKSVNFWQKWGVLWVRNGDLGQFWGKNGDLRTKNGNFGQKCLFFVIRMEILVKNCDFCEIKV